MRWSIVYIAGGYTLISSRSYERVDVHAKVVLTGGLHKRFPDLTTVNFDLVQVRNSVSMLDRSSCQSCQGSLRPCPHRRRPSGGCGVDIVCGPEVEVCTCYHNGYELQSGDETTASDGDFFATEGCWHCCRGYG